MHAMFSARARKTAREARALLSAISVFGFHKNLIPRVFKFHGEILDRITIFINKSDAEIAHAGAVDDGAANDVSALVEREAFGDAVIHHHAPIAEEVHGFLAVEPPHRRRIGTDGQAHVPHLPRAVNDGHGPEQDAVRRLVQAISERA